MSLVQGNKRFHWDSDVEQMKEDICETSAGDSVPLTIGEKPGEIPKKNVGTSEKLCEKQVSE